MDDSSRASRFAAWKNGRSACVLSMPAPAVMIRRSYSIVWAHGFAGRWWRISAAAAGTLRGRFTCSLITPLKGRRDPSRPFRRLELECLYWKRPPIPQQVRRYRWPHEIGKYSSHVITSPR
jgi:hypothetical protein